MLGVGHVASAPLAIVEDGSKWNVPLGLCVQLLWCRTPGSCLCEPALRKAVAAGSLLGVRGTCCIRTCAEEHGDSPCFADRGEIRLHVASSYGPVAGVDQRVSDVLPRLPGLWVCELPSTHG